MRSFALLQSELASGGPGGVLGGDPGGALGGETGGASRFCDDDRCLCDGVNRCLHGDELRLKDVCYKSTAEDAGANVASSSSPKLTAEITENLAEVVPIKTGSKINSRREAISAASRATISEHVAHLKATGRCLRCGERGHWAKDCRNSRVCFICKGLGHFSKFCRRSTSIPSSSTSPPSSSNAPQNLRSTTHPPLHKPHSPHRSHSSSIVSSGSGILQGSQGLQDSRVSVTNPMASAKVYRFHQNEISDRLEKNLDKGIILLTPKPYKASELLAALKFGYPSNGFKWGVQALGDSRFLVDAPEIWRNTMLSKGFFQLGETVIQVTKVDGVSEIGEDPIRLSIKISNLPPGLRSKEAIEYMIFDFARLIHWEIPHYHSSTDKSVKIVVEVPSLEVVPPHAWCEFIRKEKRVRVFKVLYTILEIIPRPGSKKGAFHLVWDRKQGNTGTGKGSDGKGSDVTGKGSDATGKGSDVSKSGTLSGTGQGGSTKVTDTAVVPGNTVTDQGGSDVTGKGKGIMDSGNVSVWDQESDQMDAKRDSGWGNWEPQNDKLNVFYEDPWGPETSSKEPISGSKLEETNQAVSVLGVTVNQEGSDAVKGLQGIKGGSDSVEMNTTMETLVNEASDKSSGKRALEDASDIEDNEDQRMVVFDGAAPLKKFKRKASDSGVSGTGTPLITNIFPFQQLADSEIVDYLESIGVNFLANTDRKENFVSDIRRMDFMQFYNTIEGVMSVIFDQYKLLHNAGGNLRGPVVVS